MMLTHKPPAEISYEAEVQQDDMQVGAVPQDVAGFLQEGGWKVRSAPCHIHCTWAELMGRQIKDMPANDEVFLTVTKVRPAG
jgi:hypothetical protein